jgi:uncharacterized protein (TIGR02246 family)
MKKLLAATAVLTVGCLVLWAHGSLALPNTQKAEGKTTTPEGDAKSKDEKALLEMIYAYREAYNRGDAKALAEFYAEHAELVDDSGNVLQGREAIGKDFARIFADNPGMQLEVAIDWSRWLTADSIIQHGAARLTPKDSAAIFTTFSAVFVKRDGKWLIAMVREIPAATGESAAQELQALAWLVGEWVDEDDQCRMQITCEWAPNKTFLNRKFIVYSKEAVKGPGPGPGKGPGPGGPTVLGDVVLECTEIIGWDASRGVLRSWVFDSHGGFAQGLWLHKGEHWYVSSHGVTADGKKTSALHIFTPTAADQYSWRSISRTLGGDLQPDIGPVVMRRVASPNTK